MDELLEMKLQHGVRFDHLASVYEEYTGKIAVENLRPSWLIFSEGFRKSAHAQAAASARSIVGCRCLRAGLAARQSWRMVAVAIKMTSRRAPCCTHQRRVGKDGKVFTIHKFRSMRTDAEAQTGAVWSTQSDPRVTRVGRFLRRTRLDELPQLWNVLRGDMSFVGPAPGAARVRQRSHRADPFYGQRHAVRPGLSRAGRRCGTRTAPSVDDALQKLQYDLFYIKHMSIAFDLFIVLETIKTVLVRRGS